MSIWCSLHLSLYTSKCVGNWRIHTHLQLSCGVMKINVRLFFTEIYRNAKKCVCVCVCLPVSFLVSLCKQAIVTVILWLKGSCCFHEGIEWFEDAPFYANTSTASLQGKECERRLCVCVPVCKSQPLWARGNLCCRATRAAPSRPCTPAGLPQCVCRLV